MIGYKLRQAGRRVVEVKKKRNIKVQAGEWMESGMHAPKTCARMRSRDSGVEQLQPPTRNGSFGLRKCPLMRQTKTKKMQRMTTMT